MFSGGDGIGWVVQNQTAASLRGRLAEISRTNDTVAHQQGVMWDAYSRGVEMDGKRYAVQFGCDGMNMCVAKLFDDRGNLLSHSVTDTVDGALIVEGDATAALFAGAIYAATSRRMQVIKHSTCMGDGRCFGEVATGGR